MAKWQNAPVVDTPRWAEAPLVERPPVQERLQAAQARQKAATERLGSFPSLYDAPLTAEQQRRYDSDVDRMAQTGLTGLGQAEIVARQAYKTPDPQASIKREMDRRRYRGFLDELGVSLESGGETAVGGVLGTVGQGLRTLARNEVFWPLTRLAPLQRQASGIDIQGRDLDKWAQTIYEDTQRWQAQPGAGGGLAGFIANAAGRTVPYFAVATVAGIVGGPGATWAVTAAIEGDSAYRDAISQGATEEEAQLERIIVGSVNGVIEMAQVGEVLKMGQGASAVALKEFKDAVAERAWKKVAKATGKLSLNQLVMAVNEGAEEVAQEWVGAGAARIIHDQPMEDMGYRTGMAFAGGVVGGGLLGGGSLVIETALTQATEEAEEAGEAQGPPEIGTGGVGFTPRIQGGMTADEMVERLGGETVALEDLAGAVQRAAVDAETKAKLEELFGKKIEVRHEEAAPAKEAAPAAAVPAEGAAPGVEAAPGEVTTAAEPKQPWEMMSGEYIVSRIGKADKRDAARLQDERQTRAAHEGWVKVALKEGKPVPRAVLEEYKGEPWADAALAKLEEKPKAKEPQPKPGDTMTVEQKYDAIVEAIRQSKDIALTTHLKHTPIRRESALRLTSSGMVQIQRGKHWDTLLPAQVDQLARQAGVEFTSTTQVAKEQEAKRTKRLAQWKKEYGTLTEDNVQVGDVLEHMDGKRFVVTEKIDRGSFGHFEGDEAEGPYGAGKLDFFRKTGKRIEVSKPTEPAAKKAKWVEIADKLLAWREGTPRGKYPLTDPANFRSSWLGYSDELKQQIARDLVNRGELPIGLDRRSMLTAGEVLDGLTRKHAADKFKKQTKPTKSPMDKARRRDIWTKEKRHIKLLRTEIAKLQPKENLPTYERTTARGQTEQLKKEMDLALASFRDYDAKYKQAKAGRDRCRQGSEQYKKRQAEMDAAEAKRWEWEKKYQELEDRHNLAQMEDRYETAPTEIGRLAALHNLLLADRDKQDIVYARIQDVIEQMARDAGATEEQAKAARSEANSVITMPRSEFYTDKLEDFITVRIKEQQRREFINEAYTKFRAIEGLTESKPFEERMKKFTEQLRYDSPQQRAAATAELNTILAEAEAQAKEDRTVAEQQRQQEQERAAKRAIFWTQEAPKITKVWSPMVKPGAGTENEIAANLQAVSKLLGRELTEKERGFIRTGKDSFAHLLQDTGDDYLLMVRESDTAFSKRLRDEAAQQLRRRYGVQVIQADKAPKPTSPKTRDDVLKAVKPLTAKETGTYALKGFNVEPGGSLVVTDGQRLLVVDRWPLKEKIKAGLYTWSDKKRTDVRFGEGEGKFSKWIDIIPAGADRTNSILLDSPGQLAQSIKATQKNAAFEYEEAAGAGMVLIRQKDGTTVVVNATMLREGLEALHKLGSVSAVVHTHGIDRPILVEGKDAKGQTLARLVQMPINRDATDWGAPANKSEFELGDVAPESKEAQPGPPLSALPEPEPSPLTQAIADKDFDTLKELLALGQDANRQRFEEITGIVLPDTEPGTENVIGEFVRGEADRYRRQSGRTTLIPDAAAELAAISRRLTGGPASLVSSAVRMFRRNIVSVNRYLRTMGGDGRLIAYDFDVITHAVTKQANNDKADLRKLFHGVSREQLRRAAMVVNERLDPKSQPKKVVDLANRMRQILDRSMNEANALGMTRKVRGKRIPIGGIGKAFPQVPNAKGVAFLKDAKVKGKGSSQVFAWAQEQVKAGRFQDVDEAIIALQQFRDQQLRAVNRYFESSRVELPVDMIEWDPVKILPHLIDRNWMTIEGVRQWGVEKHGQSFPLLRSRIERIRRDYGSDAAQRIENYVQVAFGGRSPASQQAEDISRRVRGFQFITKVGISPITIIRNMADRLPKGMAISPLGTIRAAIDYPPFVNGFIEAAQKLEERMVRAGVVFGHGSLSEGYEAGSFFSELLGGPFSESEWGNQVFIATVAYHKLMHDIAILERKGVDVTGRLLERVAAVFGQSRAQAAYRVGPDIEATILAGQEVSQEQIENFLAEAVSKNAFPMLLNTKPVWYETHPLMKVLAQFKTWPIRQTNLIYQDVLKYTVKTGDFTRLIGFLIGTLLAGEIYNLLRDWLFRKDESLLSQLRKDPESRRIGMAIFNDLIDGGGVGMVADFTYGIYDWAAGVTVRTASNVSDAVRNIRNAPGLTPQAVENLLTREVSPYRQLKGLYNRLDTAFNRDNMSKPYHMARAEAWRWKDAKEHPTAGSKIGAYADDVIWGKPDYGIGENTLAYELASRQIVAGDIGDAAKYLGYILSRAEDRKKALAGIRQSMNHRSPLGAIAERDRPAFLKSLSPETRTQIVNVQRNYLRSYNEALRQAQRNTR
jgi:hypothetical protein